MSMFKYVSKNTIEHLSLHDCQCRRFYFADNALHFDMEWMEVLASHPDNPFNKAHQSGEGKVILANPEIVSGQLIATPPASDREIDRIEDLDVRNIEILDFDEEADENTYSLKMFGQIYGNKKYDFIEMRIRYIESEVMFDELGDVSWFET